jgi:hypothetical protein
MTPHEAVTWAWQAASWVCCATPGKGYSPLLFYLIESLVCRYHLGEHHETLRMARERLTMGRAGQGVSHGRQARLLLIFVRRLTRHVEGYAPPACGWCSDTGVEYRCSRPDYWPVACHACQPDAHQEQMRFRTAADERRRARKHDRP